MVSKLRSLFGGLVLATSVAFSGTNEVVDTTLQIKGLYITSLNMTSTNGIPYIQISGVGEPKDIKEYQLQVTSSLSSNSWQNVCLLNNIYDKKKGTFNYSEPATNKFRFYRVQRNR